MIIIWILDHLGKELQEPGSYWYIAGFEFIFFEFPVAAYLIAWIRWWIQ